MLTRILDGRKRRAGASVTAAQQIKRRIVDTSLGQVHVRSKDGEGRPLLMLHMSPRSSRMFDAI